MAKKKKTGPVPETLRIERDWKDAVRTALRKPRPPEGWPEAAKTPKPKKRKG